MRKRLTASIAFALLVGTGAWAYVDRAQRRLEAGLPVSTVMVARRYIPAGEAVSPDRVEPRRVPTAYLEPTALTDASSLKSGTAAVRARVGLLKGEQLTRSKLESPSSRLGIAWSVAPGERALA
ncbi:MAG: hypothetical protein JO102_02865, partial [Elusimicrobia bacterium]|nr:hypothetical protein [Elusimicrobiota bacterium]